MIFKSPQIIPSNLGRSIFLAGSIEMGEAIDWQTDCARVLDRRGWHVFNPRRDDWDSSWVQSINNPHFRAQVGWELDALRAASRILFYFVPGTIAPISLLELGLFAGKGGLEVVCPDGFERKGNVDIVCEREHIRTHETLADAFAFLQ